MYNFLFGCMPAKEIACAVVLVLFRVAEAHSETGLAREFEVSWDLCGAATHVVEQQTDIPGRLLTTIAIAESGRRDTLNKMNVAWPWAVTSGSDSWYPDSKQEAIDIVENLLRQGVRNIDVGCMQVNLHYHSDAFRSLEDAFDPLTNVRYGASFLRKLRKTAKNWMTAAGNYHSATPEFHNRYRRRLKEIWDRERRGLNRPVSTKTMQAYYAGETGLQSTQVPVIDYKRTEKLNQAFRNRQALTKAKTKAKTKAGIAAAAAGSGPVSVNNATNNATNNTNGYALQAQINRIRNEAARQKELEDAIRAETRAKAQKRAADLDEWRRKYNKALDSGSSSGASVSVNP